MNDFADPQRDNDTPRTDTAEIDEEDLDSVAGGADVPSADLPIY